MLADPIETNLYQAVQFYDGFGWITRPATHEAHAVTGAVCVACAALTPEISQPRSEPLTVIRIEHPTGVIEVAVTFDLSGAVPAIQAAGILRTARLLFDGNLMIPGRVFEVAREKAAVTA